MEQTSSIKTIQKIVAEDDLEKPAIDHALRRVLMSTAGQIHRQMEPQDAWDGVIAPLTFKPGAHVRVKGRAGHAARGSDFNDVLVHRISKGEQGGSAIERAVERVCGTGTGETALRLLSALEEPFDNELALFQVTFDDVMPGSGRDADQECVLRRVA